MQRSRSVGRAVVLLVVVAILAAGIAFTLVESVQQTRELRRQNTQACADRVHQWVALHDTIIEQTKVQPANPIIIRAFPQFAPFYTPGTPQFAEAQRIADDKRDRALSKLGDRPDC